MHLLATDQSELEGDQQRGEMEETNGAQQRQDQAEGPDEGVERDRRHPEELPVQA